MTDELVAQIHPMSFWDVSKEYSSPNFEEAIVRAAARRRRKETAVDGRVRGGRGAGSFLRCSVCCACCLSVRFLCSFASDVVVRTRSRGRLRAGARAGASDRLHLLTVLSAVLMTLASHLERGSFLENSDWIDCFSLHSLTVCHALVFHCGRIRG